MNALLLEGTRLSRTDNAANTSERDVEEQIAEVCCNTTGIVLACYSGQNIDRLVSVYRASRRTGRTLVVDLYGASIAAATRRDTIPQLGSHDVRVWVPHNQRRRVIKAHAFAKINAVHAHRIYPEQLGDQAGGLVLTMRGSMTGELERADCLAGAAAVWSMWPDYLEADSGQRLRDWLGRHDIPLDLIHASGHASIGDLQALAAAINPDRVVPIHTAAPERYADLFSRVEMHEDGEWWEV